MHSAFSPTLPAGTLVAALGDSIIARGYSATAAGSFTDIQDKANNELAWAKAINPKFINTIWWDSTATAAPVLNVAIRTYSNAEIAALST